MERPACVLVLRLQGRGTWRRAREQERGGERATDCCCCCYGCEIAVADEMLLARLALRYSGEVPAMAMATAMLLRLLATSVAAATAGDGDAGDGAMGAMMVAMLRLPMEMAMPPPA